jgi:hypothetical protein
MNQIYRSILLLILLACSGCITDEFGSPTAASTSGQPSITVSRSDDLSYRPAAATVEINGNQVATLAAGRSYTGTVPPGPAVLKVSSWTAPISVGSHRLPSGSTSYRFNVESGKSYSFVISPRNEPAPNDVSHEAPGGTGEATEGGGGPFQIAMAQ